MSAFTARLLPQYQRAYDALFADYCRLEAENRTLRRANAILSLPRITEAQLVETERALQRLVELGES